jgi:glycerol-3-phosphate acyltransferase PlsX
MEKAPYNFVGNVEAREIPLDAADVIVTDGFGGNLILKYTEGLAKALLGIIKKELMADFRGKIAGLLAKPAFGRIKKILDPDEVGGAPLLGVQGAVVKAHGSSNDYAFSNAIAQCVKMIDGHVVQIIEEGIRKISAE